MEPTTAALVLTTFAPVVTVTTGTPSTGSNAGSGGGGGAPLRRREIEEWFREDEATVQEEPKLQLTEANLEPIAELMYEKLNAQITDDEESLLLLMD